MASATELWSVNTQVTRIIDLLLEASSYDPHVKHPLLAIIALRECASAPGSTTSLLGQGAAAAPPPV